MGGAEDLENGHEVLILLMQGAPRKSPLEFRHPLHCFASQALPVHAAHVALAGLGLPVIMHRHDVILRGSLQGHKLPGCLSDAVRAAPFKTGLSCLTSVPLGRCQ